MASLDIVTNPSLKSLLALLSLTTFLPLKKLSETLPHGKRTLTYFHFILLKKVVAKPSESPEMDESIVKLRFSVETIRMRRSLQVVTLLIISGLALKIRNLLMEGI